MAVAYFNGLLISNTHLSNFGSINRELILTLVMADEFGELALDVFDCFLFLDPIWQLTFHLLGVEVSALVDLFILLLEDNCILSVSLANLFC